MAIVGAERVAVRRHCGFAAGTSGDALDTVLAALEPDEEDAVYSVFLPGLDQLEADLILVRDSVDTKQAAVWHRNPSEMYERELLYYTTRLRLCRFLGIEPGPGVVPPIAPADPTDPDASTTLAVPYVAVV